MFEASKWIAADWGCLSHKIADDGAADIEQDGEGGYQHYERDEQAVFRLRRKWRRFRLAVGEIRHGGSFVRKPNGAHICSAQ